MRIFMGAQAKVFRVMRIFNNKKMRKVQPLKSTTLAIYIACIILLNCVLILALHLTNPLVWRRVAVATDPLSGSVIESEARCTFRDGRTSSTTAIVGVEVTLLFGMMVGGAYLCFLSRNADTKYFERESIMSSIASMLQIFAIGVPMVLATRDDASAQRVSDRRRPRSALQ